MSFLFGGFLFAGKSKSNASRKAHWSRTFRPMGFESLEGRTVLSAVPGVSILGSTFNDLTGNGMTSDDTAVAGVVISLYRDGGNGTFQGSAAGSDDTLVGTTTTGASGKYEFDNLTAGTYFIQETRRPASSSIKERPR